jgi:hypothetical protein
MEANGVVFSSLYEEQVKAYIVQQINNRIVP